jgi:hypothetical protein
MSSYIQYNPTFKNEIYVITGVDVYGKRFRRIFDNLFYASHINLYRGSLWAQCLDTGKRKLIRSTYN